MRSLDGQQFATALVTGIHRVIADQELLNKINVFPVADGDTGTNLSLSLSAALEQLQPDGDAHLGTLLASVADCLLDSARGNSGAIMAQFFQGISDSAGELNRFTTYTFAKAVAMGSDYAQDAVSEPREGTILSVVKRFSTSIHHLSIQQKNQDFQEVFAASKLHVDKALAATTQQLEVLRRAGVVDAGAKGFADLIGGMTDNICNGTIISPSDIAYVVNTEPAPNYTVSSDTSEFRYCTECIVSDGDIDRRKLRETLDTLGDSLVLAGTKRKARIHIHVDNPQRVFELAERFGDVSHRKADDMHRQRQSSQSRGRKFAVITDSAADLSDAEMERLDIHFVPLRIQFGKRGFLDKLSLSIDEFYEELQTNADHPTTSQPAPGDFRRQFQFLASHFNDVVSINLSAQVSGTHDAAQTAADRIEAAGTIRVMDSRNASVGQGQLVVQAAEYALAGLSAQEALKRIEQLSGEVKTFAMLNNLRFAVRGGRVPGWLKTMGDFLRLVPILTTKPDGVVGLGGFLIGRNKRIGKFARFIASRANANDGCDVRIGHALCAVDAETLASVLKQELPQITSVTLCDLGTAIGVHGGPGTLVVSISPTIVAKYNTADPA